MGITIQENQPAHFIETTFCGEIGDQDMNGAWQNNTSR